MEDPSELWQWIWLPGLASIIYDVALFGPEMAREDHLSVHSVGTAISIITAACALYSLTLLVMPRWMTRDTTDRLN
jgi:hypothetical protein